VKRFGTGERNSSKTMSSGIQRSSARGFARKEAARRRGAPRIARLRDRKEILWNLSRNNLRNGAF
jgi:hypothetical protein